MDILDSIMGAIPEIPPNAPAIPAVIPASPAPKKGLFDYSPEFEKAIDSQPKTV
jgi:hypothetical protein